MHHRLAILLLLLFGFYVLKTRYNYISGYYTRLVFVVAIV